ncbi:YciI family protein [Rhodococcus qingshengii]|uniref:YciI family protein n=1 Tax=Rhodococcus qingshengii TaxID=334542 RepID=A0AAW6LVR6_RHOSG|nr:YciI family protein [Rhodococcus qingshengii]MDE8649341.1 YciI family protein [Rhodococcus qingshengii]
MPQYLVFYTHPDPHGWRTHLEPHLEWIAEHVESGTILASGPTTTHDENRTAALIISASDRRELDELIATDPFTRHGQVTDLTVIEWDPIFGILRDYSSTGGKDTRSVIVHALRETTI